MTRSDLPGGTVTFLFTDVEGSTRLLEELGPDAYARALAEHRRIVREAGAAHGGVEVDTQGDAFFFAFATAPAALAAAAAFTEWLADGPIRVRVGIHTGSPLLAAEGYVGADVHRAARIAAAGCGGQVLVSASTASLVGGDGLLDLGEHRFKDLAAPERVFQLGDGEFPPIRSLYRSNLPVPATPFVGRTRELEELVALLRRDDVRLLTLIGPGGAGKTRLALQAAAEASDGYPDGVWWVSLAPLRDPALAVSSICQALETKAEPGRDAADALRGRLAGRRLLLVLDNAEHLLPDLAETVSLLRAVDGPVVFVTSRERLQVAGEHAYPVPELDLGDAVALFLSRAAAVGGAIERSAAVDQLCASLEQLPLALELAAARTVVFAPDQLLERLSQRLDLLKGGRDDDPRQHTLRATIEWSYDLLDETEQRLLRSLSVFAGGSTYAAAEEVADADPDTLQSLIDKSMLRRRDSEIGPRYWMLESIREYAASELAAADDDGRVRDRHAEWVAAWSRGFDVRRGDQAASLSRLRHEISNVRVALDHLTVSNQPCTRLDVAARLAQGMFQLGLTRESGEWLDEGLGAGDRCPPDLRARALVAASIQLSLTGAVAKGLRYANEADRLIGSESLEGLEAEALLALSVAHLEHGHLDEAESLTRQALVRAQDLGDDDLVGDLRNNLAYIAMLTGDHELARATLDAAVGDARRRGDEHLTTLLVHNLALVALESDSLHEATDLLCDALAIGRSRGFGDVVQLCVDATAALAIRAGDAELAATLLGAASASPELSGPVEAALHSATEARARGALGEERFDAAVANGAKLGLDAAAEHAANWISSARPRRTAS